MPACGPEPQDPCSDGDHDLRAPRRVAENPAITIGRMFSDTFAGMALSSAPGYIAARLIGGAVGFLLVRLFHPDLGPAEALAAILLTEATVDADRERSLQ